MTTNDIKNLITKYLAAETSLHEEQVLANYFAQNSAVDSELLPYVSLFSNFSTEKEIKAPSNVLNKLKAAQQRSQKRIYTLRRIGIGIAASLLIVLSITLFRTLPTTSNSFVMYSNGERINDPVAAVEFTTKQFEKISTTLNSTKPFINKPLHTIEQSLAPVKTTAQQLNKVDAILQITNNK